MRAAIAAARYGAWTANAQGGLTYVDSSFLALLGRTELEVLADGWIRWLAPEVRILNEQSWHAAIHAGNPFERFHTYVTADGQKVTVQLRAHPIRGEDGKVEGWAGLHLDATPEQTTHPASGPIERFLESTTEAFVELDRQFRITYVNRVACELVQRRPEALLGHDHWELFPNLVGTRIEREYRRAMEERVSVHFDFEAPQYGLALEIHVYPTWEGIAVYFRDISERRRTENRLSTALEGARAGVWEWDIPSDGTTWSPQMFELFKLPRGTTPSREVFFNCIHPNDRARFYVAAVHAIDQTSELKEELRIGEAEPPIWVLIQARVVRDEAGKAMRLVGLAQDVTDRRRAEDQLRATQESFALAMKGGRMGWWTRNLDPDWVEWSPELEEIFGLAPGTFAGQESDFLDFVHPEDLAGTRGVVEHALREHTDYRMEFRFRHASGEWRWMEGRGRATYDDRGKPVRMYGVGIDITENKQIEARYERLANFVPCVVWVLDAKGYTRWVNRRWLETTGLTGQPTSEDWLKVLHPDDLEGAKEKWWNCLRTGDPYEAEVRYRTASGEYRWFLERGEALLNESGEITEWFGTSVDIHDRKLEEVRTQLLLDSMPLIAWSSRGDGEVDFLNRHYLEFCGKGPEARGQVGWNLVVHPEDRESAFATYARCVQQGGVWEQELRLLRYDGEFRWHLSRLVPLRDDDGAIFRWFGTSTDIHDQKVKEQELEQRVEERTAELVEANREMEGFTYTVSHDLRAPLRAIMATSMILLEEAGEKLAAEERALLDRQAHNAKHLGVLIDELLKLSRISRQEMAKTRFDLSQLTDEVAAEIEPLRAGNLDLEVEPRLTATGDPKLVRFVLLNLLENACKFSPNGGKIHVGKENGAFYVRDEGIGFDPRYADKLFRPFERLVNQSDYPGTGIGLANVKRIVERHGGRAWAESELGHGATFWFTLG